MEETNKWTPSRKFKADYGPKTSLQTSRQKMPEIQEKKNYCLRTAEYQLLQLRDHSMVHNSKAIPVPSNTTGREKFPQRKRPIQRGVVFA